MITIKHAVKKYGSNIVLNVEELNIGRGEIFGLVGNNGAGKTTLFSAILDLVRLAEGRIENNGTDVSESEEWKIYTSAYLDEKFLIGYLTPAEYFEMIGKLRHIGTDEVHKFIANYNEFFNGELDGKQKYIRNLSKGNQQKVGVIGALIGQPQIVILDEPFSSLDPTSQYRLRNILKSFSIENNSTILISSHDLKHVAELCTRIVILEKGKVIDDVISTEQTMERLERYFAV